MLYSINVCGLRYPYHFASGEITNKRKYEQNVFVKECAERSDFTGTFQWNGFAERFREVFRFLVPVSPLVQFEGSDITSFFF